jgi:D-glycero-D-manno-heptose 1,7-bisphosphate phosphatase
MKQAAFLDRDGIINRKAPEGQYVTRWEELEFCTGASEAICLLNRAGFLVVIVTNQACVARGLMTTAELECMHARLCFTFEAAGATIDAIYYCPHKSEPPCSCRKPKPGMLLHAARIHDIDLARSWMIGDSARDIEAGRAAGCNTVRVGDDVGSTDGSPDMVASSLLDATSRISLVELSLRRPSRPSLTKYVSVTV